MHELEVNSFFVSLSVFMFSLMSSGLIVQVVITVFIPISFFLKDAYCESLVGWQAYAAGLYFSIGSSFNGVALTCWTAGICEQTFVYCIMSRQPLICGINTVYLSLLLLYYDLCFE